jgi:SnoaL-like polyketide cyclase
MPIDIRRSVLAMIVAGTGLIYVLWCLEEESWAADRPGGRLHRAHAGTGHSGLRLLVCPARPGPGSPWLLGPAASSLGSVDAEHDTCLGGTSLLVCPMTGCSRRLRLAQYSAEAPCVSSRVLNTGKPGYGVEHIKRQAALLRATIPDLQTVLEDQIAERDRAASRWRGTGTRAGPLQLPTE